MIGQHGGRPAPKQGEVVSVFGVVTSPKRGNQALMQITGWLAAAAPGMTGHYPFIP